MSVTQNFPFTTPSNYTYDSSLIEVTGGVAKLLDLRPSDATFYASYASSINGNWGDGTLTGTAIGGAAVSGGNLDLGHNDVRYVDYDAAGNADMTQTGCVRFRVIPQYNGTPATDQVFFSISKTATVHNTVMLFHNGTSGFIQAEIRDSIGSFIVNGAVAAWAPTAGVETEFEINWDITNGATRVYQDGTQIGSTFVGTGTRDNTSDNLFIGSDRTGTETSNFEINDIIFFSGVQHTANYTPDWSLIPATIYSTANPTIEGNMAWRMNALEGFTETATKTGSDQVQYILKKDDTWYRYSGGWVVSAQTYTASNPASIIEINKATFTTEIITFKWRAFLHSDDGSTTPELDLLSIDYDFSGDTPDTISKCIVWGFSKKPDDTVNTEVIKIYLNKGMTKYKTNTTINNVVLEATPNSADGYWEISLIESVNMETGVKYIFEIDDEYYERTVPNEITAEFWTLT